jgi:F0F1-type ATP synthase epsilon subunit
MEFQAKIITPERVIYEGPVSSISSVNDTGKFSILAEHTNFISVIYEVITIHHVQKSVEEFPIKKGIIMCKQNTIEAYVSEQDKDDDVFM